MTRLGWDVTVVTSTLTTGANTFPFSAGPFGSPAIPAPQPLRLSTQTTHYTVAPNWRLLALVPAPAVAVDGPGIVAGLRPSTTSQIP